MKNGRYVGRIYFKRTEGVKLVFYVLWGDSQKVQIIADASRDGDYFQADHGRLCRGGVVCLVGLGGQIEER